MSWNKKTNVYRGSRPDALDSFSTGQWAKEVGAQLAARTLFMEYEEAVRDQKKELRESKKREKLQESFPQLPPDRAYSSPLKIGKKISPRASAMGRSPLGKRLYFRLNNQVFSRLMNYGFGSYCSRHVLI